MSNQKPKDKNPALSVERHDTAAWRGNIQSVEPESNVPIPSEESVKEAKDWVDNGSLT